LLPVIREQTATSGTTLFRAGDAAAALYIVAAGAVEIVSAPDTMSSEERHLARLDTGQAFGEMALPDGGQRTAAARTPVDIQLLAIDKADFDDLIKHDSQLARAVERLSHDRALSNLSIGGPQAAVWAKLATPGLDRLTRYETDRLLAETGPSSGAGLEIVFGNILDTIPGCLVIGAKFTSLETVSLSLALGMFIGEIPEAAASAAMLRKAGFRPRAILSLWSTVAIAGVVAAALGKPLLASSDVWPALLCEAIAGGAVLALVAHAMIPEAIDEGGSAVVLPTVAGFLFGLYLSLTEAFGP